jgi:nitrate/nitrite transporter NarK
VIFTLLWLPFGKFFHIFQRPAQLGVSFYKDVGALEEQARCRRCGEAYASKMHVEDLIEVERKLGFRYEMSNVVWLTLFWIKAQNSPRRAPAKSFGAVVEPLRDAKSWVLSLYYFLTFGGFVAMAIYLPTFLTEIFKLTPGDAGFRTGGFVVLATAMRPIGGMLADRVGGRKILMWVFPATAAMAVFLACPMMVTFTIGALGMAAAIGLGNGAVFKLVPVAARRACQFRH